MTSHIYSLPVDCMLDVAECAARLQDIGYTFNAQISRVNGTYIVVDTVEGNYYITNEPYDIYDSLSDVPWFTPAY